MQLIKRLLLGLLALLLLLVVFSFFLPEKGNLVERSTVIDAPKDVVFEQINNLKNWEKWSPWAKMDNTMKIAYNDQVTGKGAGYSWTSENMGDGTLVIAESTPNEKLKTSLDFGAMGRGEGYWTLEDDNGKTKLTWGMLPMAAASFPASVIGKYMMKMGDMDAQIGKSFEDGLNGIKEIAEKAKPKSEIAKMTVDGVDYYGVRDIVKWTDIQSFYADNFGKTVTHCAQNKIESTGMPRGFFYEWDEKNEQTDMVAAIPVSDIPELTGGKKVNIGKGDLMDYGNKVVYDYYGDYAGSEAAHIAIGNWLEKEGKEIVYPVMEEYVTDPGTEPDPKKWLTKIYYMYN